MKGVELLLKGKKGRKEMEVEEIEERQRLKAPIPKWPPKT